jgi:hypothetical protein
MRDLQQLGVEVTPVGAFILKAEPAPGWLGASLCRKNRALMAD